MSRRILFITPSLSKGGAETQLLKIARFLKSQRHEVMIISLLPIAEFDLNLEREGIAVLFLNRWSLHFIPNWLRLFRAVKAFRPEVVIAFMFIAIIFARLLKLRFPFKLISTIRISVINRKWRIPFKVTAMLDDGIVYNSQASKENFERNKLVKKQGVVIYNGISIPRLRPGARAVSNPFVWLCIAHFRWNKDYLTLFKAIALINNKNFRVDILGNLNNESWPFKIIEKLGIQDQVRLLGFKTDASAYLNNADAFVLSSFSEGMPNAILEAMAHRKAIVATDIDGNHELISQANCGFLSKRSDPQDLAHKMSKMMLLASEEREMLGQNGRSFIEQNFDEEKVMQEWKRTIDRYSSPPQAVLNGHYA